MLTGKSVVICKLHRMILKQATPDGRIDRRRLIEVISERLGKIPENDRQKVIEELRECGVVEEVGRYTIKIKVVQLEQPAV